MNKVVIENLLRFVVLLLLQVFVCNYVHLFGLFNPNIYILALLLLPFEMSSSLQYLIAFATGGVVDLFLMTYGVHAAASLLLVFARPYVLMALTAGTVKQENLEVPMPGQKTWQWLAVYTFIMAFMHQFAVSLLEVFSFSRFYMTLFVAIGDTIFTTLLIVALLYIFSPVKKK
ncbi:MAG: hypothetical protein IJT51_03895 [Bacteroidales bacterium]|nr:hypothetical protein [Bacteroidales bacterium]